MESENKKIISFTDLNAWKEGHKLVIEIYKITKKFPREEQFGLITQLRRAVVSITSNLAEGFSRHSYKEKLQFYSMALGSLTEVQNQLLISKDVGYLDKEIFEGVAGQANIVHQLLQGLIRKSKTFLNHKS
jgi:four helix bundle protein